VIYETTTSVQYCLMKPGSIQVPLSPCLAPTQLWDLLF
jgi:hypothetical protein